MRRLVVTCFVVIGTLQLASAGPPRAVRDAIVGCWDAGHGTQLTLSRSGQQSIRAVARFSEMRRGGPTRFDADAVWVPSTHELEVSCRPRSQHGSFCRIRPEAGRLRIRVFAKGYGTGGRGRLVEDFVAARCATR